jgi:hypothetical protein
MLGVNHRLRNNLRNYLNERWLGFVAFIMSPFFTILLSYVLAQLLAALVFNLEAATGFYEEEQELLRLNAINCSGVKRNQTAIGYACDSTDDWINGCAMIAFRDLFPLTTDNHAKPPGVSSPQAYANYWGITLPFLITGFIIIPSIPTNGERSKLKSMTNFFLAVWISIPYFVISLSNLAFRSGARWRINELCDHGQDFVSLPPNNPYTDTKLYFEFPDYVRYPLFIAEFFVIYGGLLWTQHRYNKFQAGGREERRPLLPRVQAPVPPPPAIALDVTTGLGSASALFTAKPAEPSYDDKLAFIEQHNLLAYEELMKKEYHEFRDPVSTDLIMDPVEAADSFTYDRAIITTCFLTKQTSPRTGKPISTELKENRTLKNMLATYFSEIDRVYNETKNKVEEQQPATTMKMETTMV